VSNLYRVIAFVLLAVALLMLADFIGGLENLDRIREQKKRLDRIKGKKEGTLEKFIIRTLYILKLTGFPPYLYIGMTLGCVALGFVMGKILMTDTLLALLVAAVSLLIPFIYLNLRLSWYKQNMVERLEASMQVITHAYMSNKNLIKAVQENIHLLEYPAPFEGFLSDVMFITPDVERALHRMKVKEDNAFFTQWVDILIQSQHDNNSITNAPVIIDDMNDTRRAQIEADSVMYSHWRDYFMGTAMVLCTPVLLRALKYDWFLTLVTTPYGKLIMGALIILTIRSVLNAIEINKPIEI
jgi:hypothetical protein